MLLWPFEASLQCPEEQLISDASVRGPYFETHTELQGAEDTLQDARPNCGLEVERPRHLHANHA